MKNMDLEDQESPRDFNEIILERVNELENILKEKGVLPQKEAKFLPTPCKNTVWRDFVAHTRSDHQHIASGLRAVKILEREGSVQPAAGLAAFVDRFRMLISEKEEA